MDLPSLAVRQRPGDRQRGHSQRLLPEPPRELILQRAMRRWSRQRGLETLMRQRSMETGKQRLFHRRRSLIRAAGYRLPEALGREASRQGPRLTPGQRSGRRTISDAP